MMMSSHFDIMISLESVTLLSRAPSCSLTSGAAAAAAAAAAPGRRGARFAGAGPHRRRPALAGPATRPYEWSEIILTIPSFEGYV